MNFSALITSSIKSLAMKKTRLLRNLMTASGLLLAIGLMEVPAQETILASGGDATGNGGTASYSIGQVFYSVHVLTEAYITEGVQQPYEIYILSGMEDGELITLESRAYPIPAIPKSSINCITATASC